LDFLELRVVLVASAFLDQLVLPEELEQRVCVEFKVVQDLKAFKEIQEILDHRVYLVPVALLVQ